MYKHTRYKGILLLFCSNVAAVDTTKTVAPDTAKVEQETTNNDVNQSPPASTGPRNDPVSQTASNTQKIQQLDPETELDRRLSYTEKDIWVNSQLSWCDANYTRSAPGLEFEVTYENCSLSGLAIAVIVIFALGLAVSVGIIIYCCIIKKKGPKSRKSSKRRSRDSETERLIEEGKIKPYGGSPTSDILFQGSHLDGASSDAKTLLGNTSPDDNNNVESPVFMAAHRVRTSNKSRKSSGKRPTVEGHFFNDGTSDSSRSRSPSHYQSPTSVQRQANEKNIDKLSPISSRVSKTSQRSRPSEKSQRGRTRSVSSSGSQGSSVHKPTSGPVFGFLWQ